MKHLRTVSLLLVFLINSLQVYSQSTNQNLVTVDKNTLINLLLDHKADKKTIEKADIVISNLRIANNLAERLIELRERQIESFIKESANLQQQRDNALVNVQTAKLESKAYAIQLTEKDKIIKKQTRQIKVLKVVTKVALMTIPITATTLFIRQQWSK